MKWRDQLWRVLALAVVIGLGLWVASCTEWVEEDVPTPARGEAAENPLYAAQHLARALGAQVERPTGLTRLPPAQGTLWLASAHWDLFPENAQRLRAWVEAGGHLVVQADLLRGDASPLAWVPVNDRRDDEADDNEANDDSNNDNDSEEDTPPRRKPVLDRDDCRLVHEAPQVRPAFPERRPFRLCDSPEGSLASTLTHGETLLWAVGEPDAADLLRVPVGQGSVTVIAGWGLFNNKPLFAGDHAALMVAAMQVRRGAALWFVTEESRAPLLQWLWQQAWVGVLLGLLALGLALWRGAVRFGPLVASVLPVRRSMAEQVTGTAQFLRTRGADALLAAQVRALNETGRSHLPHYLKLGRGERAALLSKVTGLEANALSTALDRTLRRSPHALAATLELLETARRRLRQAARDRTLNTLLSPPSPPAR